MHYLEQEKGSNFLCISSEFHFLFFLFTDEVFQLQVHTWIFYTLTTFLFPIFNAHILIPVLCLCLFGRMHGTYV